MQREPQESALANADASTADPVSTAPTASLPPPWIAPDDSTSYSAEELSAESGLTVEEIAELTVFGLLVPLDEAVEARSLPPLAEAAHAEAVQASLGLEPPEPRYGSGALLVARISREFATYGLQARHLRVVRNAQRAMHPCSSKASNRFFTPAVLRPTLTHSAPWVA